MPDPASDVRAFAAHAPDSDLDDLRARLAAARLPEAETVDRRASGRRRWAQGVPLADLVDLVEHWRTAYDWRSFAEGPPGSTMDGLTTQERTWAEETRDFWRHRAAYAKQQATRPQTIGYALVDSPVGLLAWLLDKFAEWSDTEDSPFETISRDRILDNVTLYWLTRTGASAARIYYESHDALDPELRVDVPSAITIYPRDVERCPRPWAQERYRRIVRWRTPEAGGHFPSMEVPDQFVEDLREGLAAVLAARED